MKAIEDYIVDLLRKHDCVIMPEFGGFLLKSQPARILPLTHELVPPSKTIFFNRSLASGDGLLASQLVVHENLSFTEAQHRLEERAAWWIRTLQHSKELQLKGIGSITLNTEDKWEFMPEQSVNFQLSSFGLTSILVKPEENDLRAAVSDQKEMDKLIRRKITGSKFFRKASIAAGIVLFVGISTFILKDKFFHKQAAASQEKPASTSSALLSIDSEARAKEAMPTSEPENNATSSPDNQKENTAVQDNISKETAAKPEKVQSAGFGFFVIGGSFSREANAKKFARKMEKKGFNTQILNGDNGMYRVSLLKEQDSLVADKHLQKLRQDNQTAWILKW